MLWKSYWLNSARIAAAFAATSLDAPLLASVDEEAAVASFERLTRAAGIATLGAISAAACCGATLRCTPRFRAEITLTDKILLGSFDSRLELWVVFPPDSISNAGNFAFVS